MFRLRRVERAQAGFLESFSSKKTAFQAMDVLKKGKLSIQEFLKAFASVTRSNSATQSDGLSAFQFMDREEKDVITLKEFETLLSFSRQTFESDLGELMRFLEGKYPGTGEESAATL